MRSVCRRIKITTLVRDTPVQFRPQWRILHRLLTHLVVPSLLGGGQVILCGMVVLHTMGRPQESLHLGSVMATSFSRILGRPRIYNMHLGPIITRFSRYFGVDTANYTEVGQIEIYPVETLHQMRLV
ncbi:unnamed protein product [Linum trigynum]|uniref:Uncharacterized protein n=1 Tax=Linum trigynum TaxID=586398 RepID=A0AAV2DW62_9ROSI